MLKLLKSEKILKNNNTNTNKKKEFKRTLWSWWYDQHLIRFFQY